MRPPKNPTGGFLCHLPNRSGRYQGTSPTTWLNFYSPCKSQPISLPHYGARITKSSAYIRWLIMTLPTQHPTRQAFRVTLRSSTYTKCNIKQVRRQNAASTNPISNYTVYNMKSLLFQICNEVGVM